ncbi:MAG: hypothetical protein Q8L86_19470 [Vicinamibacterales bacterium]|nr:hypothetical protein [Vicinamibacterales bacterium]
MASSLTAVHFPLADEPHVDDWRRYAAEAGEGLWPYLQARLPQLRAPIREGISKTDAYTRLVRRGETVDAAALGGSLTLSSTAFRLELHDHPAGAQARFDAAWGWADAVTAPVRTPIEPSRYTRPARHACRIGGLGVHLVRTLMDEVTYTRRNGRNVLFIRKATGTAA